MRFRRVNQNNDSAEIDMTPMLDIVFIMLIFFIVTTSFVKESGISINRPKASTAKNKNKASILIAISDTGEIWMQRRHIDIRSVRANVERLHAENPERGVVIQADIESKSGLLVKVMDQVRLAGIYNISIAAKSGQD